MIVDHRLILEAGVHDCELHDLLFLPVQVWGIRLLEGLDLVILR